MRLYLMRHGHAEPAGSKPDPERELTPEGKMRIQNAATVLSRMGIQPVAIYSSPRARAQQTATFVAEALAMEIEVREEVNYGFGVASIKKLTAGLHAESEVFFVGHEPTMSATLLELTGAQVNMKPGSLARVDIPVPGDMRGILVWLIAPKVFDALVG